MSTVRLPLARIAHHPKKEASYGNSISDGEATWRSTVWRGEPTVPTPVVAYSNQTGRGHEFRGEIRKINAWDTRIARQADLDAYIAAWAVGFGLGAVSTSALANGYRHTFTPLVLSSTAPQLPSTAIVESYPDEGLKQKIMGLVVDEVSISGSKGEWCQFSFSAIGNGKIDTTTALSIPTLTTANPMLFSAISTASADNGGALNLLNRLRSFSWSWQNNLLADDGYLASATAWNGGYLRERLEIGNRMESGVLELVLDAERSGTNELDDLLASTQWTSVSLTMIGGLIGGSVYEEVTIDIPTAQVDSVTDGWDGQIKTRTVRLVPIYDAGITAPLTVDVVNNISAYLTAAS